MGISDRKDNCSALSVIPQFHHLLPDVRLFVGSMIPWSFEEKSYFVFVSYNFEPCSLTEHKIYNAKKATL
jgi:hypothetical protein